MTEDKEKNSRVEEDGNNWRNAPFRGLNAVVEENGIGAGFFDAWIFNIFGQMSIVIAIFRNFRRDNIVMEEEIFDCCRCVL